MSETVEPKEELLSRARASGYAVSESQLARWHRFGLLPVPRQKQAGQGKGSESLYPAGALLTLLALCKIRKTERRLPYIAWQLWWQGFDVSHDALLSALAPIAASLERQASELLQGDVEFGGLGSHAANLQDEAPNRRFRSRTVRRGRKRVGLKHFPTLLRVLMQVSTGTFKGYPPQYDPDERSDADIVEAGIGLRVGEDTAIDRALGTTEDQLRGVSRSLAGYSPVKFLALSTYAQLTALRDHMRMVVSAVAAMSGQAKTNRQGKWVVDAITTDMGPLEQAILFLFWKPLSSWGREVDAKASGR